MSKRYGLIIGSPEWVKVKEEEDAMEKKDDWKERFRTQFDHDNPFGRALVLITEEGQKPVGDDIEQFIQSEIRKAKEETIAKFIKWMRIENEISIVHKDQWEEFLDSLK